MTISELKLIKKWYWFSFSLGGKNQGCCNVKASSKESALDKVIELGLLPKIDDFIAFVLDKKELPENKLISRPEMLKRGY